MSGNPDQMHTLLPNMQIIAATVWIDLQESTINLVLQTDLRGYTFHLDPLLKFIKEEGCALQVL